jgi:hypothetical protein
VSTENARYNSRCASEESSWKKMETAKYSKVESVFVEWFRHKWVVVLLVVLAKTVPCVQDCTKEGKT